MTRGPGVRRVLMTADAVGGVWTYAMELARQLGDRGVAVDMATMGVRPDDEQRAEARSVPGLRLHESDYRLEWMRDPWQDVDRAGRWLLELERRTRPDVVHLNGYAHAALPWRAPVLVAGHSCVLSWWTAVKGEDAPPAWDVYRARVGRGLRAADLVVAPTRAMVDELRRHHGPLPRARVILNGRDPGRFTEREEEPFLLCVGRLWDEAKNVTALASVAAGLPWPVHVVGDTTHPEGRTVAFDGCRLLGRLPADEVARTMARAAVYVHPARYEPFGLAPLEAALSGCALLLADLPSLREVWGDAALFAAPDEPDALRDAAARLVGDDALRAELRARARARALELSPSRTAVGYLDAYESLVERKVAA